MTGAELRCYEGPVLDGEGMSLIGGLSDSGAPDGIQRGSCLVEATIAAISPEEIVRCKFGPVWGGAAPTPPKTRFPRRTLATRNPPASPPAVSSVFMTSTAQARDAAIHSECQSHTSSQPPRRGMRNLVESEKPHAPAPGPPGQNYPREPLLTPSGTNVIATFGHFAARSPGIRATAGRIPAA